MTEAGKKLVVDRRGVTIVGDRFQFSTNAAPHIWTEPDLDGLVAEATGSNDVESVITGLQSLTNLSYGQYCGLSRALELVGERWSMLLVRDLLVGPKNIADLQAGFPRIAADTLAARVKELERGGVVQLTTNESGAEVYELTEFGAELDGIAVELGRWGARLLGDLRAEDIMTPESLVMALRVGFQPEAATGHTGSYQVQVEEFGVVVHGAVRDGVLETGTGPMPGGADLVLEPGRNLRALLTGAIDPVEAVRDGRIAVQGNAGLVQDFVTIFGTPATPDRADS